MKSDHHQPIADRTKPQRVLLALFLAGVTLALGLSGCAPGTTEIHTHHHHRINGVLGCRGVAVVRGSRPDPWPRPRRSATPTSTETSR